MSLNIASGPWSYGRIALSSKLRLRPHPSHLDYIAELQQAKEKKTSWIMREVSNHMAFTETEKPTEMSAEKKVKKRKNWNNKIQFLLNRNPQPRLALRRKKPYGPSVDDVNQWAQSLDKLLNHKYGKTAFRLYLKSEFCEENIEFWMACEDFKLLKTRREKVTKAKKMYKEFIKPDAPKEINLDYQTRDNIIQSLDDPTTTSFLAAQKKVYSLMENNAYPRFIHSDFYKELFAAARAKEEHIKS
ncbi:regulator of G-protein signaling 5-like [Oryzias latipes]|uniref:Regulator of G protein signaling 2 n=1 Tax=Oryzias latipes TaxID=8090 RepID=A0A3B3IAQ4_ORYLA|nr:regulator of G-protein signaling 5 [Oryzias latipes]XP_023810143.1 regulator of G-protein signaling 5-like [Oryzias latipes]